MIWALPLPSHHLMRRPLSLLLLLAVWLHAVVMLPMHQHASTAEAGGQAVVFAQAQTQAQAAADTLDAAADSETCPEPEDGCVWCAWAHLAFALQTTVPLPAVPAAYAAHFAPSHAAVWRGAPTEAFQARGPPTAHTA